MDIKDFDVIETTDGGGGYEWTEGRLLRHKTSGQLYFVVESGCSCNDWESNFSYGYKDDLSDLEEYKVASWQEAVEKAKIVAMDSYTWTSGTAFAFAERLAALPPEATRNLAV